MTLHMIIFASKGHCFEIKPSLIQNHSLCLKHPLRVGFLKKVYLSQKAGEVGKTVAGSPSFIRKLRKQRHSEQIVLHKIYKPSNCMTLGKSISLWG